jgi:hypothetical protein
VASGKLRAAAQQFIGLLGLLGFIGLLEFIEFTQCYKLWKSGIMECWSKNNYELRVTG